ncbi:MAG: VOC family protein [Thermomicrobiales bacterium]
MATIRAAGLAVDCPDPKALCTFYAALLDVEPAGEDAIIIAKGDSGRLEMWFQPVENYAGPTWPTQERGQQLHLDFECDDRQAMVDRAVELGARVADRQDAFTVMLDPVGHPFCLCDPYQ